jgi:KaiC/GvpD/RAD55 family RecA-like ATPase
LVEFGYLPFKDSKQNIDLVSNLLKHEDAKRDLMTELQLTEEDIYLFQRIRFLIHMKDSVGEKAFENLLNESQKLVVLCEKIVKIFPLRVRRKSIVTKTDEIAPKGYVATGYQDLDKMMFGGIPDKYTVLLNSPSCDEKDLLIRAFLQTGIENGEVVFYITMDAKGAESYIVEAPSNFNLFLCNPEADAIVGSKDNVFKIKGVENLTDLDIALTSALRKINTTSAKSRRACIEIISDVLLQHHAVSTRRWLTALIPKLKAGGFTTLAVMNPHMHTSQEVQAILDLYQGEIQIYRRKTEKGFKRFLRIEKMHNQEYSEEELTIKKDKIQRQLR